MTIRRDVAQKDRLFQIFSGKRLAPVHPGDVLLKDFIKPMGISRYRVAKNINVPQRRIDLICRGERRCRRTCIASWASVRHDTGILGQPAGAI